MGGNEARTKVAAFLMNTSEVFLIAMLLIYSVPYLVWRLGRTEHYAPLVVVQIIGGILLLERGHRRCAVAALAGSLLLLGIAGGQPW